MSIRSHGLGVRRALLAASSAALLSLASASIAAAACPTAPTSKAFQRFGDNADYSEIPGGTFEQGGSGWTFITSRVSFGNDGYNVMPGNRSAAVGGGWMSAGAMAISPTFCIDASHPHFRFMLRPMGMVGALATFIIYRDTSGNLVRQLMASNIATNITPGYWRPSDLNPLSVNVPLLEADGTAKVQIAFVSPFSLNGPAYYIDNVLVDPYRRG